MAEEVYKQFIQNKFLGRRQSWIFYWRVLNHANIGDAQVVEEIIQSQLGLLGWFQGFRLAWQPDCFCRIFRLRRMLPTMLPWRDHSLRFQTYHGQSNIQEGNLEQRLPVYWYTDGHQSGRSRTEFGGIFFNETKRGMVDGFFDRVANNWAEIHTSTFTGPSGNSWWACVRQSPGVYENVIDFRVERRERFRRRYVQ